MNLRRSLIVSLALNLALAATAILLGRSVFAPSVPSSATSTESFTRTINVVNASVPQAPTIISNTPFSWTRIESDDYHQYVSNLQAVSCPERTIRDIIVAE